MITTTVIWPQDGETENPTEEQRETLRTMASTLASSLDYISPVTSALDPLGSLVVTRQWPTREVAQAWVDHILANYDVVSAVIDPE
jgi:hypothetical protein